jgi:hypothetical protein
MKFLVCKYEMCYAGDSEVDLTEAHKTRHEHGLY